MYLSAQDLSSFTKIPPQATTFQARIFRSLVVPEIWRHACHRGGRGKNLKLSFGTRLIFMDYEI